MKLLNTMFAVVLALALVTPSFALSEAITEDGYTGKIIFSESDKQRYEKLLDDTISKREERILELRELLAKIKKNQYEKKKQIALLTPTKQQCFIVISKKMRRCISKP